MIEPPTVGDRQWQYERIDSFEFRLRYWIGPSYQSDIITQSSEWRTDE